MYKGGGFFRLLERELEVILATDLILLSQVVLLSAVADLTRCLQIHQMQIISHAFVSPQYSGSLDQNNSSCP